jgi:SAM-dependent methyltransferase
VTASNVGVRRVDDDGIALRGREDRVLDVLFDDRRVWSFWSVRDTEGGRGAARTIEWPRALRPFLNGSTKLSVRDHVSGAVLFDEERTFGGSSQRIAVVGRNGTPMGLDKSGRMSATFDTRSEADVRPLLDSIGSVLELIEGAGIEAFLGYGTLLGAVREHRFLGHDSDADLAYVSRASTPVDVVLESFRLQRVIKSRGFATRRYSGAAFRVDVREADGVVRGLDVFAGFIDDGRLYLMGEVGTEFRMDWVYPLRQCRLEDRSFPVPAVPEKMLEAMYGPSWAVPDPAFKFTTSPRTIGQLTGWFRGTAVNQQDWERAFSGSRERLPRRKPSPLARRVLDDVGPGGRVLDVGAGRGGDALWLARAGVRVTAYDYVPQAAQAAQRAADEEGLALDVRPLNLTEWRSVFGEGARLAQVEEPRAILARHVADATSAFGRGSLARFASMTLRNGGRLHLDVWTGEGAKPPPRLRPVKLDKLARLLESHGATIVQSKELPAGPEGEGRPYSIGRLVAQWD